MPIKKERRLVQELGRIFFAKYEKEGIAIIRYWDMEEIEKERPCGYKNDYYMFKHDDCFLFLIPHKKKCGYSFPSPDKFKYGLADYTQYCIINPGQSYLASLNPTLIGKKYTRILIHKDFIKKIFLDLNLKYPDSEVEFKIGARLRTAVFDNIYGIIHHGFHSDNIGDSLFVETALHQFITHILKTHPGTHSPLEKKMIECLPDDNRIRLAIDYMRNNFDKNITLDELSKISCLSKSHFLCLFKKKTGESPYKYLCDYRIKKAVELLKNNDKSHSDISCLTGIPSERQLYYHIRKRLKKTPRKIKKEMAV